MRIGMREIIEDYLDGRTNRLAMTVNDMFALVICVVGLLCVAKIVFWG
jgi:succinate dehydrogenase hydrophobic anchor subunit